MSSLGIITINFNRPRVLKLWCAQIKRLRTAFDLDFPAVVVSDISDVKTCADYNVAHIIQENKPVTEKFNTAMRYMRTQEVDAVMILGSDDLISSRFYLKTLEQVSLGIDYIGIKILYFYAGDGQYKGRLVKLDRTYATSFFGTGRTVSRTLLDQCDWRLWDMQRNWGMDAIAVKNINLYAKTRACIDEMLVDVKTRVNLNRFNVWGDRLPQIPATEFYKILSEEELQILNTL